MSVLRRREIPITIMMLTFAIVVIEYYIIMPTQFNQASLELQRWGSILAAFAIGLGLIATVRYHGKFLVKMAMPQALYSGILLLQLVVLFVMGLSIGTANELYLWWYDASVLRGAIAATTLVLFYSVNGWFRSVRARSFDSAVALIAMYFFGLYYSTLGDVVFPGIVTPIGDWLAGNPLMFSVAPAATYFGLVLMLRILTGREKSYGV